MIRLAFNSPCCGQGMDKMNQLIKTLEANKLEYGYATSSDRSKPIQLKLEDDKGVTIMLSEEDLKNQTVLDNLIQTLKPKQEITTK
jgi:hypothetical protein